MTIKCRKKSLYMTDLIDISREPLVLKSIFAEGKISALERLMNLHCHLLRKQQIECGSYLNEKFVFSSKSRLGK